MRSVLILLMLTGSAAASEPDGPPRPAAATASAAQAAMASYRQNHQAVPPTKPCARANSAEVVVCAEAGRGGSANRLPLPDERRPPDIRIAIGEPPHMGVGGSPAHHAAETGLTLTIKANGTKLRGNGVR